ncbi:transporter substrate-binding domain-containing protein [Aliiglaciecola sp. CAU 1673]|uniref:substrate-binding periplasmic protein n=1 Tax=Aliiglaciecola sp. CAU 1673 TaxID=3032595 RepID=UPI0023DC6027|nr:transporter substrate-binding domain-containing protein [Aliiglaciecola sp. CAU 1673]MDF2179377.1 transporter substrate-binding domain-containing protein [Aliiglaciecola sp. CAU 1673]
MFVASRRRLLLSVLFSAFLCSAATFAEEAPLRVLFYQPGNPPYTLFDGNKPQGIFADLFARIEEISDLKFELMTYPVARGLAEFDAGNVDIEPGVNPDWRRHMRVLGVFSIPYAISEEVVVFAPGKLVAVNEPADLFDKVVGIVRGFSYPRFDAAFSTGLITRLDNLSYDLLAEQLLLGRLNQIFIGLNTILYFQKMRPEYQALEVGDVVDSQQVMLRIHPSKEHLLPVINQALEQMKTDGEIEAIYARYR